jgi:hypothetical protein
MASSHGHVSGTLSGLDFVPPIDSSSNPAAKVVTEISSSVAAAAITATANPPSQMTKSFKERFQANLTDLKKSLTPQADSNRAIKKANDVLESVAEIMVKNSNVSADEVFDLVRDAGLDENDRSRILFLLFGEHLDIDTKISGLYTLKTDAKILLNDTEVQRLKQQTTGNFVELCDRGFSKLTDFARKDSLFLLDSNQDKFGFKGESVKNKIVDFFLTGVFRNILNFGRINFSKTLFDGKFNNLLSKKIHTTAAGGDSNKFEKLLAGLGLGLVAAGFLARLAVTFASFVLATVLQVPVNCVGVVLAIALVTGKLAMKAFDKLAEKVGYFDQEFRDYHAFKISKLDLNKQGTLRDFVEISPSLPNAVNLQVQVGVSRTLIDQIREAPDYKEFRAVYPEKSFFSFLKKAEPTEQTD